MVKGDTTEEFIKNTYNLDAISKTKQTADEITTTLKKEKHTLEELNQEIINKICRSIASQAIRVDVSLDIYQKLNNK